MYKLVCFILVVIALWFLQGQRSAIRRHGKRLPRPPGTLPLAGNGLWFLQHRQTLLDWFVGANHQTGYSNFEISVPSLPPTILISDPKNVEHVLKNNDIFIKGNFFRSRSWDLFVEKTSWELSAEIDWVCSLPGNGIINADGDLWKIQRKAGLRFFSNANLKTFIDDALPPILADKEGALDDAARKSDVIDMQDFFLELTTRLMGKVAYDMDMPASLPFSKAFDYASAAIGDRFQNPFWRIKEFLLGTSLRRAIVEVKHFGNTIVSSTVQKRQKPTFLSDSSEPQKDGSSLQANLIDSLLDHISDHRVVADAAMNYLSAGRDTTAQSLTWTLYLLCRHPQYQQSLLDELHDTFSSQPATAGSLPKAARLLNFETVQPSSLPLTYSIFLESLRLYPPVPLELKECTAPTTFPDGTWLPEGSAVLWVPWAMGRSFDIWGPDAETFRPERWLSRDGAGAAGKEGGGQKTKPIIQLQKSAYEFPVFNAGPRSCLGKKLAEVLAVDVLARLISRYQFEEVLDQGTVGGERRVQNSLTLPMEGGLPVRVRVRG
ncbi:MAG: hypothetical protein LQ342_004161 [Letrouitia transgressa]|nr:MAG: hypothetical protein LQ342_004161 [Letrouitia transgressa]